MTEIPYTENDDTIEVEITRQMRGLDVSVPSGDVGVVTPCPPGRFTSNPTPAPDSRSACLTGRYENTDNGQCFATAQINQAGKYIFGWFQVDFAVRVEDHFYDTLPAVSGYFRGPLVGNRANVQVIIESPSVMRGTSYNGRIECRSCEDNLTHANVIRLYFRNSGQVRATRSRQAENYSISFQWTELRRVAPDPRLPSTALESMQRTQRALYQSECHPLRTEQVRAIRTFVDNYVKPGLQQGLAGSPIQRLGSVHNFFAMFSRIFRERRFLGITDGCPFHGVTTNMDLQFKCSCGMIYRSQQSDLVKMLFLHILETDTVSINGSPMPLIEAFYQLGQDSGGADFGPFRQFRDLWGSTGGQPVLPTHLARYKYRFDIQYIQGGAGIPRTVVGLGGRGLLMRISRFVRNGSSWTADGRSNLMPGLLGIVKLELAASSRGDSPVTGEVGVTRFEVETYRNWRWSDFPGIWEIFKAYTAVRIPFNIYSSDLLASSAVIFHGSGSLPPIVGEIVNSSGNSIDSDHRFQLQAGFVWMPGYLWPGTQARDSRSIDPRELPQASVDWSDNTFVCFQVNSEQLTSDGRDQLGLIVAENLPIFLNRSNHIRIDGHTSRTASWYHNNVLSIRRSQFALQSIIDILGDDLHIPLERAQSSDGDGSVRIFGHGEQSAMQEGDADRTEDWTDRRVDVAINGSAVARLGDQRPAGSSS